LFAIQRTGQDPGARCLAAPARSAEKVRVVDATAAQRLAERFGDMFLSLDLGKGGGPVAPVQGERRVGDPRAILIRMARAAARPGDVACHDLICTEGGKGPLAHPPEPAYPCCLPALGELAG